MYIVYALGYGVILYTSFQHKCRRRAQEMYICKERPGRRCHATLPSNVAHAHCEHSILAFTEQEYSVDFVFNNICI